MASTDIRHSAGYADTDQGLYTYADFIVDYLYSIGVRRIFGVPGGAIEPFFDALARHARRYPEALKVVVARHESGAAFMAAGYARETGRLGVCCSTTGPGATNLATGVASAYVERDPILVITPQTARPDFGRRSLQDSSDLGMDIVRLYSHVTLSSNLVSHSAQLKERLTKSVSLALNPPCGPVHLSIPMDILWEECPDNKPDYNLDGLIKPKALVDEAICEELTQIIGNANKIVFLVGGECSSVAMEKIITLAELTNSAIVSTPSGKTWLNAYHYLFRGVFGFAGHESARQTLLDPEVDILVAIGSRLDELSKSSWENVVPLKHKLVHVDSVFDNFSPSSQARLCVYGDIEMLFSRVIDKLASLKHAGEYSDKLSPLNFVGQNGLGFVEEPYTEKERPKSNLLFQYGRPVIKPQSLMQTLNKVLPENARVIVEAGAPWSWAIHYLHLRNGGNFRAGINYGAMTWAIGNAIGAASAEGCAPIVILTSNDSMLMSGQEITVAVAEQLPVLFIVLNNSVLEMNKNEQSVNRDGTIGHHFPQIDFAVVAKAMGVNSFTVHSHQELEQVDFEKIFTFLGPTLLDVRIDPMEKPPMGVRRHAVDRRSMPRPGSVERRTLKKPDAIA
jgi:acetolactate synthase-1/2/3 large subunit